MKARQTRRSLEAALYRPLEHYHSSIVIIVTTTNMSIIIRTGITLLCYQSRCLPVSAAQYWPVFSKVHCWTTAKIPLAEASGVMLLSRILSGATPRPSRSVLSILVNTTPGCINDTDTCSHTNTSYAKQTDTCMISIPWSPSNPMAFSSWVCGMACKVRLLGCKPRSRHTHGCALRIETTHPSILEALAARAPQLLDMQELQTGPWEALAHSERTSILRPAGTHTCSDFSS